LAGQYVFDFLGKQYVFAPAPLENFALPWK